MKPSEVRSLLYLAGQIVLRPRVFYTGNGRFYRIVAFNGSSWQSWDQTMFYKTEKEACEAINLACVTNPSMYIDDANILSGKVKVIPMK